MDSGAVATGGPLLEREAELGTIASALAEARDGSGRVLLVEGPPGIGKTRLLAEARASAETAGMRVLAARGGELERTFPYGVVRQLFEPVLAAAHPDAGLLDGAAALAEPALGSAVARVAPSPDATFAIQHGLYWLTANLAGRSPVAIVVDDAHWADAQTLRWLAYLVARVEGLPVAVVLGARPAEPGAAVSDIDGIGRDPVTAVVRPGPLTNAAVAKLLTDRLDQPVDDAFVCACADITGGNPFLTGELIAELVDAGIVPSADAVEDLQRVAPRSVARSVKARLRALPPAAGALATAVAVMGREADLGVAAKLADVREPEALEAADALVDAGILREGYPLAFAHPLLRQALYGDLRPARRAWVHGRAARIVAARGGPIEEVAVHLLEAGRDGDAWVVDRLRAAAQEALASGAADTGAAYLRRALDEPPTADVRADLLLELGTAEALSGSPNAIERLAEYERLAPDARRRAQALMVRCDALTQTGRADEAVAAIIAMIDDEDDAIGAELRLELEAAVAAIARTDLRVRDVGIERLRRLRVPPPPETFGERSVFANQAIDAAIAGEPADHVRQIAVWALGDGELLGHGPASAVSFFSAVRSLMLTDWFDETARYLDLTLGAARVTGSMSLLPNHCAFVAELAYRRGNVARAEEDARAGIELARHTDQYLALAANVAQLVDALAEQGRGDEAEQALEEFKLDGVDLPRVYSITMLLASRARMRLLSGRPEAALADALECGRRADEWRDPAPASTHWRSTAALAYVAVGDRATAQELVAEELERARAAAAPRALGIALRAAGIVVGGEEGTGLLRESVDVLAESDARLEHARALESLGAARRRAGCRREAQELLREALDLADRCGAVALATRAREEAVAAGARPRRTRLTGAEALTASERRVARMAAEGMTNREIAQELIVTQKAVERHLSSAYGKLGISSRRELPEVLQAG